MILFTNCYLQVDLFFYGEPEEAKDQEIDENGVPVPDFGVTEYGGGVDMIANDQWAGDQWTSEALAAGAGDWLIQVRYLDIYSLHTHYSLACLLC
ncbi:hypothetical protein MKW94_016164 [Papaver nudicaule]|uniref:Uncharacterized protein n=1 Tax=Papaver nudicaule TaxID=74823 RepID=A0AA41V1Q4_PAPNU|nr:hypothetical protein [Papaver nudicaule]